MKRPPKVETSPDGIPSEQNARHEFLVDAFGLYLFWALDEALKKSKDLVNSDEAREKLGRAIAEPYSQAASKLNPENQKIAFGLAEETLHTFAKNLLSILGAQGITFRLGEKHAMQFRLTAEIHDIGEMNLVFEEIINRIGRIAFQSYWGHWLNINSTRQSED